MTTTLTRVTRGQIAPLFKGELMAPEDAKTGSATTRTRPAEVVATKATATTETRIPRRRYAPRAFASVFAPDARRTRWLVTFICPHCKLGHRALADSEEDAEGLRPRGACGRRVQIVVARAYRGRVVT